MCVWWTAGQDFGDLTNAGPSLHHGHVSCKQGSRDLEKISIDQVRSTERKVRAIEILITNAIVHPALYSLG